MPGGIRFDDRMNDSDGVLWTIERDPALRTTICAVALLDRPPDFDRLMVRMRNGVREIPRLAQRVVEPPLRLGPPRWVSDGEPDLAYHVRRVIAPPPASIRTLLDMAEPLAMAGFDRARPLWEFTVVEGLEGGKAALIQKIHHSLTDGVGGIRLALLLLDRERDGVDHVRVDPILEDRVSAIGLAAAGVAERTGEALRFAAGVVRSSRHAAWHFATDPFTAASAMARTAGSVARTLAPATTRLSPVLEGSSLSWRFDLLDVPLDDLRRAAKAGGGTLNDAFVAAVTGGMRRYHQRHGGNPPRLRMTMPISYRDEDDPLGGNRFIPARFTVPVAEPVDAAARIAEIGALCRAWRDEPALPLTDAIAAVLNRLPSLATTLVLGSMLRGVDFVATNVPGVPFDVYLAGAKVLGEYAFAPPSGAAVNIALVSHVGTACIGVNADRSAIRDPDVFVASLREGFDEVLALAPKTVRVAS